jgi:tetratricopeptide (TPR) repeat protein
MNSTWLQGLFLVCTILFGLPALRVSLVLIRLLKALTFRIVNWPGPLIHDRDPKVSLAKQHLGLKPEHLLPNFIQSALALIASFVFFLLMFISGTSYMADSIRINWTCPMYFVIAFGFFAGFVNWNKAAHQINQVNTFLSDSVSGEEPHNIDGTSAEAEYAINHPLLNQHSQVSEFSRALQLFCDGTLYHQSGNEMHAVTFYQEAIQIDPNFHEHARDALSSLAQTCCPRHAGPIYYWLGIHSEYLMDHRQAKYWYEKAVAAFSQIGYPKRESRAHCNLGNVKMQMKDPSAMDEFEKAVTLNPKNGTAYINIGTAYYRISERGDPMFDRALDAYANAIIADPARFGPTVISHLREYGYTWKEDIEDITRRVEKRRRMPALNDS